MGLESGVAEIPDSEDESMTSSPVEGTNLAQRSQTDELGTTRASQQVLHREGRYHKRLSEAVDLTTSTQNKNLNQAPVDDALTRADTSEKDQVANAQSPDYVQQVDVDFRSTLSSEDQPYEFETATDLPHLRKEHARTDDTDSSSSQQTPDPRPKNNGLGEECHNNQRDGIEHSAVIARQPKHEATAKVQGAARDVKPAQEKAPGDDPASVAKGNTTQPLQSCASTSTVLQRSSLVEKSGTTEPVYLHCASTRFPNQENHHVTGGKRVLFEDTEPNPSSNINSSSLHMTPDTHEDMMQHDANDIDHKQIVEPKTASSSDIAISTAEISSSEHTGAEAEGSRALPVPSSKASIELMDPQTTSSSANPETLHLPPSSPKGSTIPKEPSPKKKSQEITLAELKAQRAALLTSLVALPGVQDRMDDTVWQSADAEPTDADVMTAANRIVKNHIKLLHEYNEIKDVGQGLMGLIADQRGVRIIEVQDEFGIGSKD